MSRSVRSFLVLLVKEKEREKWSGSQPVGTISNGRIRETAQELKYTTRDPMTCWVTGHGDRTASTLPPDRPLLPGCWTVQFFRSSRFPCVVSLPWTPNTIPYHIIPCHTPAHSLPAGSIHYTTVHYNRQTKPSQYKSKSHPVRTCPIFSKLPVLPDAEIPSIPSPAPVTVRRRRIFWKDLPIIPPFQQIKLN